MLLWISTLLWTVYAAMDLYAAMDHLRCHGSFTLLWIFYTAMDRLCCCGSLFYAAMDHLRCYGSSTLLWIFTLRWIFYAAKDLLVRSHTTHVQYKCHQYLAYTRIISWPCPWQSQWRRLKKIFRLLLPAGNSEQGSLTAIAQADRGMKTSSDRF